MRKCSETVVGLEILLRWVVNWSAVFVETVFESSSGYVLFGAVVALYLVNDVF